MVIKMNKIDIKKIDEHIYHKVLDNGINVYMYKANNTNEYKASFFTKYGSIHNDFKIKGDKDFKKVPLGIAHFLEHKLFESETKEEPMEYFAKSGTSSNAYTSFFQTCYYIEGSDNFEDNLNYLLDFVQEPYFTNENVEKEKGIIEQELQMYNDNYDFVSFYKILYNLMNKHNIKYNIGGTVEEINKINKDMLYDCYNTFYSPNNMTIVVTGNIDINKTLKLIENNQNNKKILNREFKLNKVKEDKEVSLKHENITMNVDMPMVSFGIKIPISVNLSKEEIDVYINTIIDENFGKKSDFYIKNLEDEIISGGFSKATIQIEDYILVIFNSKSKEPKKLIESINQKLNNLNITETFFERQKKNLISSTIYAFENHFTVNDLIEDYIISYDKTIENIYADILNYNFNDLNQMFNSLNTNNTTSLIISK